MAGDTDAGPATGRWRRRALVLLAVVLLAAIAVRVTLTIYAADLFVAALARALAGSGAEVVFAEAPRVSTGGFESKGVVLRSRSGEEWVRADAASGSAHLFLGEPWISVALKLKGVRATWSNSPADAKKREQVEASAFDGSLPPTISRIELEDARIDLGEGRTVTLNAALSAESDGSTRAEVGRLDYSEPSGERAAEKISGVVSLLSRRSEPRSAPKLDVRVESGAALSGTVLLDFTAHPLTLAGTIEGEDGKVRLGDLAFAFGKLLRGTGRVVLDGGSPVSADVRIASDDLAPAFATLVREPFAGVAPALTDSELKGKGEIRLELAAPSRHRADASVTLSLGSLRTRSVEADALSVEVPWIGAEVKGRPARSGRIRARRLSLLGVPWTGVDLPVEAASGRLRAKSVQEWKAAGGTLRMTGVAYEDDAAEGPRLVGSVELVGFDLAAVGRLFGTERLAGSLRGNLGRVRIDGGRVRAEGAIDIEAFGGSLRLSGLHIEEPFSRVPQFGLDATLREIDLAALTQAFGLGRVSGVLEGDVKGLVLVDGQPQAFDADIHTADRRGVSKTIDVKAIVQLGVLSGDTGSLTGSLLKMIDRYRYSEMGVRCRLRNDVFEIHGVETRDGRDYLVKGSRLPPSVSVVIHSQVISFSEMLRRIERITTIGEGGTPNAEP